MTAYRFVNQAEVTIPGVNDKEEMQMTDVRIDSFQVKSTGFSIIIQ